MPSIQKSPRLLDAEQARQALLRGRELTVIRDAAGHVTHYRFVGTPACVAVETFDALLHTGLVDEIIPAERWAIAPPC
jgi:hypothetical protein